MRASFRQTAISLCLLWLAPGVALAQVPGATCPAQIDANDCVANDLQPTGAEVINGPSSCTEGNTFSATVRISFDNGGGANARYNIGFFVGENGDSAIGGAACTFDSLQPVAATPGAANALGGPYIELSNDACGDLEKSPPAYKDIQLDRIACKDDDGDGNVDISYVLTWSNNANQTNCTDPLDPAQFDPAPPKCLSDLEYDLPIEVEDPPSIQVAKGAFPAQLEEPGGTVRFPITIVNTSAESSDSVRIVSIIDQVQGQPEQDITSLTTCVTPFVLAPGENKTCTYVSQVSGVADDTITDTVTVIALDDEGESAQDSGSATVTIIAPDAPPDPPGDLRLVKFASPRLIDEPGGTVEYDVLVANVSVTPVTLESLVDDLYGDLNGKGNCRVPQLLAGLNSLYFCAFREQVTGQPGDTITDTIVASGVDATPAGNVLTAQGSATVTIDDVGSKITVRKTANPELTPEPGGTVLYTLEIENRSPVDTVTITNLLDSRALGFPGPPNLPDRPGACAVPFDLLPGEIYSCSYELNVTGNAGDFVTNVVDAIGIDDDGAPVFDFDAATVTITGQPPELEVTKLALPREVPPAGGTVAYIVAIQNTSTSGDPVTVTGLTDAVAGGPEVSLDGVGSCDLTNLVLQPAPGIASFYLCSFSQTLDLNVPGTQVRDVVTASGLDDEGVAVSASDDAVVTYVDSPATGLELTVIKNAAPNEVIEPGGPVTFTVFIGNTTPAATPSPDLTLTALGDDIYGDLFAKGDCGPLQNQVLPPTSDGTGFVSCSFTESVSGAAGDLHTNVVTATGTAGNSATVQGSDDATVTIIPEPASIEVTKRATPALVTEPGADVTFEIKVFNTSSPTAGRLFLSSLIDNIHGDLLNNGLCPPPEVLFPGRDPYRCEFTVFVGGEPGFEERNTVTAIVSDRDGNTVEGAAQATVTVLGVPPSITTTKTANPSLIPAEGGLVSFTFTTTNTSTVDVITLETLDDNVFGDLNGQGNCSVPQVLQPGQSYSCVFSTSLSGMLGQTHLDIVTVSGATDDGDQVASSAVAIVRFVALVREIPALGQFGLGVLVLLTAWLGWRRQKSG